jgi:hypothetical protein
MIQNHRFRASYVPLGASLFFALVVFGCGGGSGSGGQVTTTGSGGSLMPDAQRATILANANAAMQALVGATGACDSSQLLAAEQKVSGLTNLSVAEDGSVVGTFSDGVPMTFVNNLPIPQVVSPTAIARVPTRSASSSIVKLMDSEDPIFVPSRKWDDAAAFSAHGYAGTSLTVSTVEALKALGGSPIGVLGIAGHGGLAKDPYTKANLGYGIWTATKAYFDPKITGYNGDQYRSDLIDHSMGLMCAVTDVYKYKGVLYNRADNHYCILSHFPVKYGWNFSDNSYVSLGICYGASDGAAFFRQTLYSLGATVIVGWTNSVLATNDYYNNSYAYDRMLGSNTMSPVTPPRRPFPWPEVLTALGKQGNVTVPIGKSSTTWTFLPNPSLNGKPIFTILNPAIVSDYIQPATKSGAEDTLHVEAYFGVPGGTNPSVTVGSAAYSLATSTPFSANYPLDYTTSSLPNSANGSVVGNIPGLGGTILASNPRNISAWNGSVTCTYNSIGSTSGKTTRTGVFTLHFRNDLQSSYSTPDATTPTMPPAAVVEGNSLYPAAEEKTTDSLQVTGSGTSVSTTIQGSNFYTVTDVLSGGSSVSLFGTSGLFNGVLLSVPPLASQSGYLEAFLDTDKFLTDTETITQTGSPPTTTSYMANMAFSSQYFLGDNGTNEYVPISVDGNFNVSPKTFTNGNGANGTGVQEILACSAMPCTSPPVTNTAR